MCIVSCADGSEYTLVSTVPGALMEVNDRLTTAPELLTQKVRHLPQTVYEAAVHSSLANCPSYDTVVHATRTPPA